MMFQPKQPNFLGQNVSSSHHQDLQRLRGWPPAREAGDFILQAGVAAALQVHTKEGPHVEA